MTAKIKRLALGVMLAVLTVGGVRTIYPSNSQDIKLRRLALNHDNAAQRQVGALEFIAAWELRSRNADFGGVSALVSVGNSRFVGIGDAGTVIGFRLTEDGRIDRATIAPLPNVHGPNISYKDRDSEGLAYDPDSGQYWVSFEGKHAIRRYSKSFAQQTGMIRPAILQKLPRNKGAESIVRLQDGRFIIIAESLDDEMHSAWVFSGDPIESATTITPFTFRPPVGYRVTDAVQLPDGRIVLLNRAIGFPSGFTAKVSLLNPDSIGRDSVLSADVIASLAPPLLVDNMEGIAVTGDGDKLFLWLISDNNFTLLQRTILMKFRLL
ncbi:MAG: esterase-like activity of phytase family protein [Sphingomonadaceae bacterium]|jgi:hypothetical protein